MKNSDVTCPTLLPCELCHHDQFAQVASRDRSGAPLPTVICLHCGLVFTNPRPTDESLDQFYRQDYRREYKQAVQPKLKHVYRAGMVAAERLAYLLPLLKRGDRVLDLGAGGGELLYLLRGLGYQVEGIEPNVGYGTAAREVLGLSVQVANYREAEIEPGSKDVVTAFHVVEHLPHPVEALQTLAGWMRDDGLMLIEVPNVLSRCQWPHSRYHKGHLHHFSSSTLALAGGLAGLVLADSFTSSDGGNVMVVFRKQREGARVVKGGTAIPGHAQRVLRHLSTHTRLAHALSVAPYARPLKKVLDRCQERLALLRAGSVHGVLDDLVQRSKARVPNLCDEPSASNA